MDLAVYCVICYLVGLFLLLFFISYDVVLGHCMICTYSRGFLEGRFGGGGGGGEFYSSSPLYSIPLYGGDFLHCGRGICQQ